MVILDRIQSGLAIWAFYGADNMEFIPKVCTADYFIVPSVGELITRECLEPGYCCRVSDFTIGRIGYGHVKFFGETDVRWLEIEKTVEFNSCEVWVYRDESNKPSIGKGLNKAAEVTLFIKGAVGHKGIELDKYTDRLKTKTELQGAQFISFNASNGEWKFHVQHFSRFGLDVDEDDDGRNSDTAMQESPQHLEVLEEADEEAIGVDFAEETPNFQYPNAEMNEVPEDQNRQDQMVLNEIQATSRQRVLSHSLPEHLGLDPEKMQQMKILFLSADEEAEVISTPGNRAESSWAYRHSFKTLGSRKTSERSSAKGVVYLTESQQSPHIVSAKKKASPNTTWQNSPYSGRGAISNQRMLEYNKDASPSILMTKQNKGEYAATKRAKVVGFHLDAKSESPISMHSRNVVDAALFMGKSFRVGWGPNGLLVHSGTPVGQMGHVEGLSSLIKIEQVAIDKIVRDEQAMIIDDLVDLKFISPLNLHMRMSKVLNGLENSHLDLKLRALVCSRSELPDVCEGYQELIGKQVNVPGLSRSKQILLMHQSMVWHLLSVLFSERETNSISEDNNEELDGMQDIKNDSVKIDPEAEPLIRRAHFSGWLQESVCHRVQEEISHRKEGSELEQIFSYLSGRQLDEAVQLAAYRGDVRLACLLSQAGSMINRKDMASQIEMWDAEGLDYSFMEKNRLKLYKLLAGDIQGALEGNTVDWKRYLGLLMWYDLPPDTSLSNIIKFYQELVDHAVAPSPVPIYIDEGPLEEALNPEVKGYYDLTYYLMLLHASDGCNYVNLKKMFTSSTSTYDALDYHMTWHQHAILQAIGVIEYKELHLLTMSFVSQLLCVGECHWAIYAILHMPPNPDYPMLHEKVIKEILFQYCEIWNSVETQKKFIEEELGIPSEWMHEALAVHCQYYGDSVKALEHFLKSLQWQRAHSIFMTLVAPALFCSSQHSEIWKIASLMEGNKSEIADWDLGAGIYMDFYTLRQSFEENQLTEELASLEKKNISCRDLHIRLKESLCLWRNKFPLNARVAFSKMADEVAVLLMSENRGNTQAQSLQISCFDTIIDAPVPEDLRLCRLQDAVSVFTSWLSEVSS